MSSWHSKITSYCRIIVIFHLFYIKSGFQRVIKTLWKPDIMWFYLPDMTVWFYSISISLETQYEMILSFLYVFRCFNQHIPRLSVNISRLRKIRAFLEVLNALSRITAECAGNLSIRHIIIIFADYIEH